MAVALSTGLIIAGGLSAAGSIYSAKKQGDAAKKAAEQQQTGVKEARAYGEPLYARALDIAQQQAAQGQAGLAPFAQQGTQGLYALSDFLGVPRGTPAAAPGAGVPAAMAPPSAPAGPTRANVPGVTRTGQQAVPRAVPLSPGGAPGTTPLSTASSYVLLRAPSGETQSVPAAQADFYLARGATRV